MPEYLAPGVYVEETSFRAKSIEGVSTSTTAFVGPTRRGPVGGTPELVTSFADFARIYGGLGDLFGQPNYVAHAVRAYFNEGGSRLYVSRAFQQGATDGRAVADRPVVAGGTAADRARFVARLPGSAGNGRIVVREIAVPATKATLDAAPEGSLARTGGDAPATGARVNGGAPPFVVRPGNRLLLTVGGVDREVEFRGQSAEVVGDDQLGATVNLAAELVLEVRVGNGAWQTATVPANAAIDRGDLVSAINGQLVGAYARLTTGAAAERNFLAIGTDRKGFGARIEVRAHASLAPVGLENGGTATTVEDGANNVEDVNAVSVGRLDALLVAGGTGVRATLDPNTGTLALTTVATGAAATLAVRGGAGSAHAGLGLAAGAPAAEGSAGPALAFYVKRGTAWLDSADAPLAMGAEPGWTATGGLDLITLYVAAEDADGNVSVHEGLGFDPAHPRFAGKVLATSPTRRADFLEQMYALEVGTAVDAFELHMGMFSSGDAAEFRLGGGNDGDEPGIAAYGAALDALLPLDDISIVAAPGESAYADHAGIQGAVISFVSRKRAYQIAVLDTPPAQLVSEARLERARIDSHRAAIYYPWVTIANPQASPSSSAPKEIQLPPSGFLCGIYARNDAERGVHKAPANEVVRGAIRFESDVNTAEQDVLNPLGVNCLRFFPGRGFRVWGARTASSDPEWKYVNVRRYFNYLERSIDQGTQWAVFEPNGERLWANIRETVGSFLYTEWRNGALLGGSPKEAYFVRCDRSTMTQNDLDNGRLICQVGVAVVKPAEFVIFQIGQKTADAKS